MNSKWSESLCRSSIHEFLIDDAIQGARSQIPEPILEVLRMRVESKDDLKRLKKCVNELKSHISKDALEAIREELDEIAEDFKWASTSRGKYVMKINDWVQSFHADFNAIPSFKGVVIGGHAEKMVVFVTGEVLDRKTYEELMDYVNSKDPPYKLFTKVKLSNERADQGDSE